MRTPKSVHELVQTITDAEQLKLYVSSASDINELDGAHHRTPIANAAARANQTAVNLLVRRKAALSKVGVGDVIFWSRHKPELLSYFKKLFEEDAEIAKENSDLSLAHFNAALGDVDYFQKNKEELLKPNRLGITPAFYALACDQHKLIEHLDTDAEILPSLEIEKMKDLTDDDWRTLAFYLYQFGKKIKAFGI